MKSQKKIRRLDAIILARRDGTENAAGFRAWDARTRKGHAFTLVKARHGFVAIGIGRDGRKRRREQQETAGVAE